MTQQINLLEPSLLPKREWCTGRVIVAVVGVLSIAVGAHYMHESAGIKRALASGSPAPSDAAASGENSDPIEAQLREGQSRLARGEMLMKAVAGLTDLPRDNARRLQVLIAAMPDTVWLQEVEFSGERGVRIVGGATPSTALAGFSQSLGATKEFQALPLHVYALAPRDVHDSTAAQPPSAADTKDEHAPAPAPHYRFVLSSVDAERAAHKEAPQ